MIIDVHVHIHHGEVEPKRFIDQVRAGGVDRVILLSLAPECFPSYFGPRKPAERLDHLFEWTEGHPELIPFFWIDPTEADAVDQVARAVERGVSGFKVICNHFYPGDERAMPAYHAIAEADKPILFHSGILWDGTNSSEYCRPAGFEAMIDVPKVRFALAHISWPWIDEHLAVYGKFLSAKDRRPELACEMFIDLCPGTPEIYRKEALTKIHTIGYKVDDNILFGTDATTAGYSPNWGPVWVRRDNAIYDEIGVDAATREKIYYKNALRFLGVKE